MNLNEKLLPGHLLLKKLLLPLQLDADGPVRVSKTALDFYSHSTRGRSNNSRNGE